MIQMMPVEYQSIVNNCINQINEDPTVDKASGEMQSVKHQPSIKDLAGVVPFPDLSLMQADSDETDSVTSEIMEDPNDPEWIARPKRT